MPWVRIDDHFDEHPKHAQAGPLGWALWAAGLAYCNRNLTDGFIPWSVVPTLVSWKYLDPPDEEGRQKIVTVGIGNGVNNAEVTSEYVATLLVFSGLWEEIEGGFYVHDYPDYQPLKRKIIKQRKQIAERVSRFKQRKSNARGNVVTNGVTNGVDNAEVTHAPVPVPVPLSTSTNTRAQNPAGGASGDCIETDRVTPKQTEIGEAPIPPNPPRQPDTANNSKALRTTLTDAQAARAKLVCESLERAPQKSPRFAPWPCLQRMVSGGLEPDTALEILRRLRDRWEKIVNPWAYVQSVLDKEHVKLAIRVRLEEHERKKREPAAIGGILAEMAERGRKERKPP